MEGVAGFPAPRVSVVTPFLNAERFLAEAVTSVLAQTYASWELLLVDDGSSDGSARIARESARREPDRIRYLAHAGAENRGASAARNLGFQHARGEFLALLDADDVWLPHKLEEQVALLDAHPQAGSVCANTLLWYSWTGRPEDQARDTMFEIGVPPGRLLPPPALLTLALQESAQMPCTCSLLLRRDVVERIGGFESGFRRVYTDQAFYTKLFIAAPVLIAGGCSDWYRQHPASSVAVAAGSGELARQHLAYLDWAADYLASQGLDDSEPAGLIDEQRWRLRHPRATRFFQMTTSLKAAGARLVGRWSRGTGASQHTPR